MKVMPLRDYQNELLDKTRAAYREGYHAPCIVAPCGAGKSVITAEMAKCATEKGNRVLFLVHRQELCEQIFNTFVKWGVNMHLCQIGMVQTICRRLSKIAKPSLIITDENHHSLAGSYRKIYDYWPDVQRVGVTATPIRLNGGGLGDVNDVLILGPSVKQLISWGNLSPFKYYAPRVIDTSKLRIKHGDYVQADIEEAFNKNAVYGDVIAHYQKLSDGLQAICYCVSIEQSKKMAFEFSKAGINARHLDGDTPKEVRNSVVQQFREGVVKILCNVDLISEGFDVPDCNTAILLRPTQSLSLYIQQAMRCMRYKPGKTAIIIDHVGNVNRFGMPDVDRSWDLTPKKKGSKKKVEEIPIRQCLECFAVFRAEDKVCPSCGWKPEKQVREVEEMKNEELVEVESQPFYLDFREPEDCSSLAELQELARNRGYKSGWAYYQAKRMQLI